MHKLRIYIPEISVNKIKPLHFHTSNPSLPPHRPPSSVATTTTTTTGAATRSFNSEINKLSAQGDYHQVIGTYCSMIKSNVAPDAFTYPSLLKACTSLNLCSHGLLVHNHVLVSGLSLDPYIATSLLSFYSKFGCTSIAQRLFDAMPEKNIVPWTAIIGCYSRIGDINKSMFMYNKMQCEGIKPASATIVTILSGNILEGSCVKCLHSSVIKYGFDGNLVLLNCMLSAYGKLDTVDAARNLFDSMNNKDLVSWNSLLSIYTSFGDVREILGLWNSMKTEGVEPDQQTFTSLVPVISKECKVRVGKTVHGLVVSNGFLSSVHVKTSIMSMYFKHGHVDDALRMFESAEKKDMVLWTALISGLVQNECGSKAMEVFRQMLSSGVVPSSSTMASALAACAQVAAHKWGTSLHGYIMRQGIPLDIPCQNSLVTMYAKCGSLERSIVVFRMMDDRDVVSWNAIVAAHAQDGNLKEAFFLFNEMRMALKKPDSITVVSLLQACASIGAYQQGRWIHAFIIRSCLGPCIMIDTVLVDMYCKCGSLDIAKKCFENMSQHDAVSWSTIIAGYGSHGQGEAALEVYYNCLQDGFKPNATIFLSILSACSHNGLVNQGMSLFESMINDFKIAPELEHLGCIVDLLCRAGRVEDAYNFYSRMFPEPAVDVLGILLDACRAKGKVELADYVGKQIALLNPADPGKYVQLAHSYASMGNWDGVGEAWGQMRSLGLKKIPGWSFIELQGTITTFYRGHIYEPRYEDITLILKILSNEIKEMLSSQIQEDFFKDSESDLMEL